MDYKAIVAETPHVLKYLRKTIEMPVITTDINKKAEVITEDVKYGVVVAVKVGDEIKTGWSVCSNLDSFSKSKGRAIALLRATSEKPAHYDWVPTRNFPDTIVRDIKNASDEMYALAKDHLK